MRLKTISKLMLGLTWGTLLTISVYACADDNNNILAFNMKKSSVTIPVNEINDFAKVYSITKGYYVESVEDAKLMKGAINGMLNALDPHSSYLDANDFKQLSEVTAGSFAGLGIEVSRDRGDGVKVVAPIFGTPAYYAGIKSGDVIIKVDGVPIKGMSLDEAIKKMRGKAGTKVKLTIARANELKPFELEITREKIVVKSVQSAMLDTRYGYVRITNFQADTTNQLTKALQGLYESSIKNKSELKGLILDLRDNPGGLLPSGVGVSSVFLPEKSLVVYTDGRMENTKQKLYAKPSDYDVDGTQQKSINGIPKIFKTIPMVVLVNQGSASASEIVAGALQDYRRAKVLGTKTFGKGSVQSVLPLSKDTAIKLTTALYYTPKGRSIQAQGINPDIIIQSEYNDILDSWDLSEASLNNHIDNPNDKDAKAESMPKVPVIRPPKQISTQNELKQRNERWRNQRPKVTDQSKAIVDLSEDFQLKWALNIIEGKPLPVDSVKAPTKSTKVTKP